MKSKFRAKTLFILLVIFSIFTLSACSSGSDSNAGKTKDGKTLIRFATWDSEDSLDLQKKLVDTFNKEHSDIQVKLEAYGSEYDTKIAAGMGSKDAPDVMYMWNYPQYKDALEPLDSYIEGAGAGYKDNFYEALWNYNSADDKILGLPVGYTTHVVYYNKDLFDAKGIPYPTGDWTWDDFQKVAAQLTDSSTGTTGFVFPGKPDPYDFEMYLWGNGAAYSDENGELADHLNSPKSIEVFDMFQKMEKDKIALASEKSGTDEMKTGKVGMFINGAWYIDTFKNAGINFGVVEVPHFEGHKSVSVISSSGLAMSKDSKNKDAAFEFMKFWTNEEANKARINYELPVLKSVVEQEKLNDDPVKGVFYSMLENSEGFTPSSFRIEDWSTVADDLNLVFEEIFNPSTLMDPKKALNDAVQ